ncbi:solute carrier family 38 member 10-like isoform X3 [Symsagittifera roscoffensis]|uniref:solute carrier family 38 member 10-like isoform X3 n=1 Tax=Symsagittifera roscoffensis TaxID=84072 RepID=UPI00307BE3A8
MVRMASSSMASNSHTVGIGMGGSMSSSGGGMSANYRNDLIWSATVNLANSIVGVSLLSMPYALKRAGLILGLLCIFSCAYFTYISCRFLARAACAVRRKSFQYLVLFSNGVLGKTVVELSVIGLNIGCCVAFFVVIGDVAAEFLSRYVTADELGFYKNSVMIVLATVIVLPLALVSDIGKFAKLSAFSLVFYVIFALYVFVSYMRSTGPSDSALKPSKYPWVWYNFEGVMEVAPIIAGSFTCQPALFPLMETLEDDTPKSIEIVTKRAMIFVATLYSSVGIFGYLMFGDSCLGDMLHNFHQSPLTDTFKLCFAFSILFSFPLVVYPLRSSLETLLFQNIASPAHNQRKTKVPVSSHMYESEIETSSDEYTAKLSSRDPNNNRADSSDTGGVHIPSSRFMKMTFFIVAFTLTTGILIPHVLPPYEIIEKILAFTGSTAGMLISMIVPSIIYLKVLPKGAPKKAKVTLVCGLLLMVIGTLNVLSTTSSNSDTITQILYEKSLRRPAMFKIDDAIKEDYLKQKKMIEEQIAAQEQKLAQDEEELKKRKEDLVKQKEELIGQPQKQEEPSLADKKSAGEPPKEESLSNLNANEAEEQKNKPNESGVDAKPDSHRAENKLPMEPVENKQDVQIEEKQAPNIDEKSNAEQQPVQHEEVKQPSAIAADVQKENPIQAPRSQNIPPVESVNELKNSNKKVNNIGSLSNNVQKEKESIVPDPNKAQQPVNIQPEPPQEVAREHVPPNVIDIAPKPDVNAAPKPDSGNVNVAAKADNVSVNLAPKSENNNVNVAPKPESLDVNVMANKEAQPAAVVDPNDLKLNAKLDQAGQSGVVEDAKNFAEGNKTALKPGDLPAKTGAEDGLLKQLKETQELQEKLMEHQNQLINKLEGEHEPHEGGGGAVNPNDPASDKQQALLLGQPSEKGGVEPDQNPNQNLKSSVGKEKQTGENQPKFNPEVNQDRLYLKAMPKQAVLRNNQAVNEQPVKIQQIEAIDNHQPMANQNIKNGAPAVNIQQEMRSVNDGGAKKEKSDTEYAKNQMKKSVESMGNAGKNVARLKARK